MKRYALLCGMLVLILCAAQQTAVEKEAPQFNPKNVKTYQGEIMQVFSVTDPYTGLNLIGIVIRTDKGEMPVELGPPSFVLNGPVSLVKEKEVRVKGSEQNLDGKVYIIAQELKVDKYTLRLRDKDGAPLWTGWKRS